MFCAFLNAGADPGPVVGEGTNPLDGGADPPNIFYTFSENPHEIKEILVRMAEARRERPLLVQYSSFEVFRFFASI